MDKLNIVDTVDLKKLYGKKTTEIDNESKEEMKVSTTKFFESFLKKHS